MMAAARDVRSHVLGFPRMGSDRQLKKLVESYWNKEIDSQQLTNASTKHYVELLRLQQSYGIDYITCNDFSLYDHILDWSYDINAISSRYSGVQTEELQLYFAMARGIQTDDLTVSACEMKKWYDTNVCEITRVLRRHLAAQVR